MEAFQNDRLKWFLDLHQEIEDIKDLDGLLERVLCAARELARADAGSIYTVEPEGLVFRLAQNDTLQGKLPDGQKLVYDSFVVPLDHHSIAGHVALSGETLNIPDVYKFDFSGRPFRFDPSYDARSGYRTKSMLTLPMKNHADKVIGVMQLINACDESGAGSVFPDAGLPLMRFMAARVAAAIERGQITRSMILRMIRMAQLRDPGETAAHANRVGAYSAAIYEEWAERSGIARAQIDRGKDTLRSAAMLHDVGKVGVADHILQKPGRLDAAERAEMQLHTLKGAELFGDRQTEFDGIAAEIALNHHEKWDGSGYPSGKRGAEIPAFARLVAVADVFDALSTARVYKPAWPLDRVLAELNAGSGSHFDPDMIRAFTARLEAILAAGRQFPEAAPHTARGPVKRGRGGK